MPHARLRAATALVLMSCAAAAQAGPIYLNGGSTVQVTAASTPSSTGVTALPYTTQTSTQAAQSQARIDPILTSDALVLQYTGSTTGGNSIGQADLFFHVTAPTTFDIYGALTTNGDLQFAQLSYNLIDKTTGAAVSNGNELQTSPTSTLRFNNGSVTGSLIAGHDYEFTPLLRIIANGSTASGSGSGSISLAFTAVTPEPAALSLTALGAAGLLRRRRA